LLQRLAQAVLELAAVGARREELPHRLAGRFAVVGLPAVHPVEHAVEGARVDALSQLDQLAQQGAAGFIAVVGHRLRSSGRQAAPTLPKFVTSALLSPYREKSKLRLTAGRLRRPGGNARKRTATGKFFGFQ